MLSLLKNFIKSIILSVLFSLFIRAEDFKIFLEGSELKKLSAIEIQLEFPEYSDSIISDNFSFEIKNKESNSLEVIPSKNILYSVVDSSNKIIRLFVDNKLTTDQIIINGKYSHPNYSEPVIAKIKNINYISDFALSLDSSTIANRIDIDSQSFFSMPFIGISRADILNPIQCIVEDKLPVTIGNIETYGFDLNKKDLKIYINDQNAKLLNGKIVSTKLELSEKELQAETLDIILSFDLGNQKPSKKIGNIKIIRAI